MNFLNLFTSIHGRIGRQSFWIGLVILMIAQWILAYILMSVGLYDLTPQGAPGPNFWIGFAILMIVFIWPAICLYAKRYHDRDKSGWWQLIALIPIIGIIWMLIECGFLKGTQGDNRFGPDPLG